MTDELHRQSGHSLRRPTGGGVSEARFDEAKQQIMAAGSPSDGANLDGMSIDFDAYLFMAGLFDGRRSDLFP